VCLIDDHVRQQWHPRGKITTTKEYAQGGGARKFKELLGGKLPLEGLR